MSAADELTTDAERAECLQNILLARATGGGSSGDDGDYRALRAALLDLPVISPLLPRFVKTCRDLSQFWGFIKYEKSSYAGRRDLIWQEFQPLMDHLEGRSARPSDAGISEKLKHFDAEGVQAAWAKALERRNSDPEGAITSARTLLETVCRHILDESELGYQSSGIDLPELYKLTATQLNLAPSQHTQDNFKKILGGVMSVVNELGSLRNRLSDAHGHGKKAVRPASRHAELAVNLAGTISLFLIETYTSRDAQKGK